MKFLIVENSSLYRRKTIATLSELGYQEYVEASDGFEAIKKLEQYNFDFVIVDSELPRMSGIELVRSIRSSHNFYNVPIILVIAAGIKIDILSASKAGVNSFLRKPFTAETLGNKINGVLKSIIISNVHPVKTEPVVAGKELFAITINELGFFVATPQGEKIPESQLSCQVKFNGSTIQNSVIHFNLPPDSESMKFPIKLSDLNIQPLGDRDTVTIEFKVTGNDGTVIDSTTYSIVKTT